MRLCNLVGDDGLVRAAVALDDGLVRLDELLAIAPAEVAGDWPHGGRSWGERTLPRLPALAAWLAGRAPAEIELPRLDPADVRFAPPVSPVPSFRDFYAFEQHVRTARGRRGLAMIPAWYDAPVFYFSNARSMVGDGADVATPPGGEWLDYELEVACVIGREGRDIPAADAERHVAGYAVLNDWSLRDVQRHEMQVGLGPAKGKDFATSLGPYLVTPDELADRRAGEGYALQMTARVNGRELSRGSWDTITFGFGAMIERASAGVTLFPGDVLGSGTVGTGCILELGPENTGGWLRPGDEVELAIERLGVLRNRIVAP